jgi:chromosome segregation ATPase
MNEAEIKKHIDSIYEAEATLATPLGEAHAKIQVSQMRLYAALYRGSDIEKARSVEQIEAAETALQQAKQFIDEIATRISTLEVSMTVLKGLAKGQL